jgi:uncharacterized protein YggE
VAYGIPDRCLVNLSLNVVADTASNALDQLADLATKAVEVLRGNGVESNDIQMTNLSLEDFHDRETKQVTARVASYSMTVRTRSVEASAPILAWLSEVAGDSLRVHHIQLAISNPVELQVSARRDAVADAAARARQLAESAGVSLGRVLGISEGQVGGGRDYPMAVSMARSAATMPIEAGEAASAVAVTVTYEIGD